MTTGAVLAGGSRPKELEMDPVTQFMGLLLIVTGAAVMVLMLGAGVVGLVSRRRS